MPKIAIDISPLNNGNSIRGVGYYTKNLVSALQSEIKTNPEYSDFEIQLVTDSSKLVTKFDLIHYPYFDPFYLTLPPKSSTPTIISIHDLISLELKKMYPVGIRGWLKWQLQRYKARQAKYIITISHYSKYIISDILRYPVDKIYVTHLAADDSFKKITDQSKLLKIKNKYHLPDKFVLYLGDVNQNKNISSLISSCIQLKYPLVIIGKQAKDINALTLEKQSLTRPLDLIRHLFNLPSPQLKHITSLKKLFENPLILRLGFVPDEDVPTIFNLATIYCQPSYSEGFGLPLVQAMQSGLPVIYSYASSLPEVMDYCGLFFDPHKPEELITQLKKFWTRPSLRLKYSKLGLVRSKVFSWQNVAIQTLAVYKLALLNEK